MAVVATLSKGYDLDYIWKQVDQGPVKDGAGYYIQASESGGEPPGRWWVPARGRSGLEPGQLVEREPYDLLFGEHKAPDGTQLGSRPAAAGKPPTSTPRCWPPSRMPSPSGSGSCGWRRPGRRG